MMRKSTSPAAASSTSSSSDAGSEKTKGQASVLFQWSAAIVVVTLVMMGASSTSSTPSTVGPVIAECSSAPWRPNENLVGTCPEIMEHKEGLDTPQDCASSCCLEATCTVWQFRADKGCLQYTSDVRIGLEKDGPADYCSDHPPLKWQGQHMNQPEGREKATECSGDGHPDEQLGQCFGLGDSRPGIKTAKGCAKACCDDKSCQAWQFQKGLGCFYNEGMDGCQPSDDPIKFEPFVGRRKFQASRTYTDENGDPTVARSGR